MHSDSFADAELRIEDAKGREQQFLVWLYVDLATRTSK